jgi:hypothetical protein
MKRRPLWKLYDDLNRAFFDGRLPKTIRPGWIGRLAAKEIVVVRVGINWRTRGLRCGGRYGVGRYSPPGEIHPARIEVIAGLRPEWERRVLLHEMIHADLYVRGEHDRSEDGHGPKFRAELQRLAELGEAWAAFAMNAPGASSIEWEDLDGRRQEEPAL